MMKRRMHKPSQKISRRVSRAGRRILSLIMMGALVCSSLFPHAIVHADDSVVSDTPSEAVATVSSIVVEAPLPEVVPEISSVTPEPLEEPVELAPESPPIVHEPTDPNITIPLENPPESPENTENIIIPTYSQPEPVTAPPKRCITVKDTGEFCMSDTTPRDSLPGETKVASHDDPILRDQDIFLVTGAESTEISHNDTEDLFPSRDPLSGDVVWQTNIDGHWQIMLYDNAHASSTPVSITPNNQMQPYSSNGTVVWQEWIDGNWEIMKAERSLDLEGNVSWTNERLTQNTFHDMFPTIGEHYIAWQSFIEGSWHITLYSLDSKEPHVISDAQPGNNELPKLMVVWNNHQDATQKTFGYEVSSGTVTDLGTANTDPTQKNLPQNDPLTTATIPKVTNGGSSEKKYEGDAE